MKNKILLSVLTLFVAFVFTTNVYAQSSSLNIPWDTEVKAPVTVPADGTVMVSSLTDPFDFSRVQFASGSGSGTFYGDGFLRKILLAQYKDEDTLLNEYMSSQTPDPNKNNWLVSSGTDALGQNWFSAYCLDGELKYPDYGAYTSSSFLEARLANNNETVFNEVVLAALINQPSLRDALSAGNVYDEPTITYAEAPDVATILGRLFGTNVMDKLETNTVKIANVKYGSTTISAADLTGNPSATYYELSFNALDIAYLKYTAAKSNDYNAALWIIEHSYPTIGLETLLTNAGTSYSAVSSEIAALQANPSNACTTYVAPGDSCPTANLLDTTVSGLSGDELRKYVESYVYSTIQYAIWKVQGSEDPDGNEIGNSITNVTSLNKLFQYLINVPDLTGYGDDNTQYTNTITITKPQAGKEIKEEKNDYYVYGPYVASYSALTNDPVTLTVTNSAEDKENISIIDNNGTVINSVPNGGAFYVKVMKKAKIASVTLDAKVENVTTFIPSSDRARVYSSIYPLTQNVMSGGKVAARTLTTSESFNYNAKTGVENVAMLLMVTLVAFSLGYMVLSFKAKPLGLN